MARYSFKIGANGQVEYFNQQDVSAPVEAPFVHGDELKAPLQNPVTGTTHYHKSTYLKECDQHGLQVVGNDLLSKNRTKPADKISDERMFEALQHAEAIHSDPSRKRQWEHKQLERYEKYKKAMGIRD